MKKIFLSLLIILSCTFAFAESKIVEKHISTTYIIEGKIDNKYPIKMYLELEGDKAKGKYYYLSNKKYIALEGVLDNGTLSLEEYLYDKEYTKHISGYFKGSFNKNTYTFDGEWINAKTKKTMPCTLTKSAGINGVEIHQVSIEDKPHRYSDLLQYPIIKGGEKVAQYYKVDREKMLQRYKEYMADYDPEYYVNEEELTISFEYVDDKSISFIVYWWAYTGGAHGNTGHAGTTYDIATGKAYETADLIADSYKGVVNTLLKKRILENYTEDELFNINEVELNDNFYIDIDGVHYQFTPYEIAPWSTGHVYASFTFEELKPYIKKGSPLAYVFGIEPIKVYDKSLQHYISSRDIKGVKYRLEMGDKIGETNRCGWTNFSRAAESGDLDIVKLLVKHGAVVKNTCTRGLTPMYIASSRGHIDVVKYLYGNGANISTPYDDSFDTPLWIASMNSNPEVAEFLISKGADASRLGVVEWANINRLDKIKNDPTLNENLIQILDNSARNGYIDIVKFAIERNNKAKILKRDTITGAAVEATVNNHIDVVKYLISNGANKDYILIAAVSNGYNKPLDMAFIKYLVENGADVNATLEFLSVLGNAVQNYELYEYLLSKGADANSTGFDEHDGVELSLLMSNYDMDIVKLLVEHGADIDYKNEFYSVLQYAANAGDVEKFNYLLALGANSEVITPVDWYNMQHVDRVKHLIGGGYNLNTVTWVGIHEAMPLTLLMSAVNNNDIEFTKFLVNKKATIDFRNEYGYTALMFAIQNGELDMVKLLIDNGAKVSENEIEHAQNWQRIEVLEYLKQVK